MSYTGIRTERFLHGWHEATPILPQVPRLGSTIDCGDSYPVFRYLTGDGREKCGMLWQVFFPDRVKDLDCDRVFVDRCPVPDAAGNVPAVARPDVCLVIPDPERHVPADKVSRLFVRVGVPGKLRIFLQPELGHERVLAPNKGLLGDAGQRPCEAGLRMMGKHFLDPDPDIRGQFA